MIYRVVIKISYMNVYFDFITMAEAGAFAETAMNTWNPSEDSGDRLLEVSIRLIKEQNNED